MSMLEFHAKRNWDNVEMLKKEIRRGKYANPNLWWEVLEKEVALSVERGGPAWTDIQYISVMRAALSWDKSPYTNVLENLLHQNVTSLQQNKEALLRQHLINNDQHRTRMNAINENARPGFRAGGRGRGSGGFDRGTGVIGRGGGMSYEGPSRPYTPRPAVGGPQQSMANGNGFGTTRFLGGAVPGNHKSGAWGAGASNVTATISRNGDLVHKLYIQIDSASTQASFTTPNPIP